MLSGRFPDITPAQIVALVTSLLALLVAFGADLDAAQEDAMLDLAKIVAAGLFGGDAAIRIGRNVGRRRDATTYADPPSAGPLP